MFIFTENKFCKGIMFLQEFTAVGHRLNLTKQSLSVLLINAVLIDKIHYNYIHFRLMTNNPGKWHLEEKKISEIGVHGEYAFLWPWKLNGIWITFPFENWDNVSINIITWMDGILLLQKVTGCPCYI